jgi:hypothetical protein
MAYPWDNGLWDFNFPGELYIDSMIGPVESFAFLDNDGPRARGRWADHQTPGLHLDHFRIPSVFGQ